MTTSSSAVPVAGDPFDPDGVVWQPVSGKLAVVRLAGAGSVLAVLLVVTVVLAASLHARWLWLAPLAVVLVAAWVAWLVPRQVRAMGYAERADDLLIRRGIMFRRLVVVPYGRLQYLDVQRGPVARAVGVASLQLHTASAGSDASIDGLPDAEAERLRDQLAARGEARLAGL